MRYITTAGHRRCPMSDRDDIDVNVDDLVEETLVEEVSIDGMCGVY
jgi:mycofactocin precursor